MGPTLAGKSVLVTGANRGLGQALVEEALRRGARRVFDGVQAGEDDIFPDPLSETLAASWRTGPVKEMERQNAVLVAAAPTAA